MYTITQPALIHEEGEIRPRKRANIRSYTIDGEAVLYHERNEATFHLNQTAFVLWDACDGHRTLGDLAGILRESYDVDVVTAKDDVDQIVAYLAGAELVAAEVPNGTYRT